MLPSAAAAPAANGGPHCRTNGAPLRVLLLLLLASIHAVNAFTGFTGVKVNLQHNSKPYSTARSWRAALPPTGGSKASRRQRVSPLSMASVASYENGDQASVATKEAPEQQQTTTSSSNSIATTTLDSKQAPKTAATGSGKYRLLKPKLAGFRAVTDMWDFLSEEVGDQPCLRDSLHGDETVEMTYDEAKAGVESMAGAMQSLGVGKGDCVSIFAENSYRWLLAEQGIMKAGACNAVRGMAAPLEELQYIYDNSRSKGVLVEKGKLLKDLMGKGGLSGENGPPEFYMIMYAEGKSGDDWRKELGLPEGTKVVTFRECLDMKHAFSPVEMDPSMTAAVIYTSGTTSKPKGVVLRHSNLLHQMNENSFDRKGRQLNDPWVGDTFLTILPCWHIFERTAEYFCLSRGVSMVYSSIRTFKKDLVEYKPHFLIAVPRLFETIYNGVQNNFRRQPKSKQKLVAAFTAISMLHIRLKRLYTGMVIAEAPPNPATKAGALALDFLMYPLVALADKLVWSKVRDGLGGRLKCIVSGGSSLGVALEDFFEMTRQTVLVGYGLTETSPVICNRVHEHNLKGSIGFPPPGTTLKIVDPDTHKPVTIGQVGQIWAKGPQITREYNRDEAATEAAFDKYGFFDTGDLGRVNGATGDFILTGRAKDTIVLSNGENIEPQPIEDVIVGECKLVDQATLVGQDERSLGAILTLNPLELAAAGLISDDEGRKFSRLLGSTPLSTGVVGSSEEMAEATERLCNDKSINAAVKASVKKALENFRAWEQVQSVHLILEPMGITNGLLTQTLKVKRPVVATRFEKEIAALYKK